MGSSGGGSSGKVDYPTYLKHIHGDWLANVGDPTNPSHHDKIELSMAEIMNAAFGSSPFTSLSVFDPDTDIATFQAQVNALLEYVFLDSYAGNMGRVIPTTEGLFKPATDYASILESIVASLDDHVFSTAEVDADINAFGDLLSAQIESDSLPRFRRGMQNINAVMSSSYVIGAALIEENRTKEVTKYGTALRLQNQQQKVQVSAQTVIELLKQKLAAVSHDRDMAYRMAVSDVEIKKALTQVLIDSSRTKFVMKKEELEDTMTLEDKDARWDLEVYTYGGNLLAAVGGGTSQPMPKQDKTMSAIGGGISGAASGAQMGASAGPYGAIIGGIIGAVGGAFMGSRS